MGLLWPGSGNLATHLKEIRISRDRLHPAIKKKVVTFLEGEAHKSSCWILLEQMETWGVEHPCTNMPKRITDWLREEGLDAEIMTKDPQDSQGSILVKW